MVSAALHLMYQAALVCHRKHEAQMEKYRDEPQDDLPVIYRKMALIAWPSLARKSVEEGGNKEAKGACIGLTRGNRLMPYIFMPPSHYDLVHTVIRSVKTAFPDFKFTSAQFNVGLCAGLHTDSANVGPPMIVAVGPHTGGSLWHHQPGEGRVHDLQAWTQINGRIPHKNLPFYGKRGSIVLFTHSALCSPAVSSGTVKVVEDLASASQYRPCQ